VSSRTRGELEQFKEVIYREAAAFAVANELPSGLEQVLTRMRSPDPRMLRLADSAALLSGPQATQERLGEAWTAFEQAREQGQLDDDRIEKLALRLIERTAVVNAASAALHVEELSVWERHLGWIAVGEQQKDPANAAETFERARSVARLNSELLSQFHALANVAAACLEQLPGLARDCQDESITLIDRMDPYDRVVSRLRVVASAKYWPHEYVQSMWQRIEDDLTKVGWSVPECNKIFKAAGRVEDPSYAAALWNRIATALLRIDSWGLNDEFAEAVLNIARRGDHATARNFLLGMQCHGAAHELPLRAYMAAIYREIQDREAPQVLKSLLVSLRDCPDQGEDGWDESLFAASAVELLAGEYKDLAQEPDAIASLLEVCARISDLRRRSDALEELVAAVARNNDFIRAIEIASTIPIAHNKTDALDRVFQAYLTSDHVRGEDVTFWHAALDVGEESLEGILGITEVWTELYFRLTATPTEMELNIQKLISELDELK
jgi:hypothetical protein